ncbi:MAG: Rieske 2Fe-2S domain-containing protein [Flavobacteriaceae bacterium]|nr:Rieske 2Fe-2S domain-containing protein [Flavobacteriaceae bacterium]
MLVNCESDDQNNLLPYVLVNETINLSNPEFINIQVSGGWAYANGGIKGIVIYNVNGNSFKAYERSCPHLLPSACSRMTVEQSFKLKCPCDQSEFNILNGTPLTPNINYVAREYKVTIINANTLKITNF